MRSNFTCKNILYLTISSLNVPTLKKIDVPMILFRLKTNSRITLVQINLWSPPCSQMEKTISLIPCIEGWHNLFSNFTKMVQWFSWFAYSHIWILPFQLWRVSSLELWLLAKCCRDSRVASRTCWFFCHVIRSWIVWVLFIFQLGSTDVNAQHDIDIPTCDFPKSYHMTHVMDRYW